jgi:hypothetical protein
MNKKQFDHIEDRIRDAAANSEPAFDEQAWAAMELRLNKEDKRRRFVFWWFALPALFIVGAALLFFYNNPAAEKNDLAHLEQKNTSTVKPNETDVNTTKQLSTVIKGDETTKDETPLRKNITTKADTLVGNVVNETNTVKKSTTSIDHTTKYNKKNNFSQHTVDDQVNETSVVLKRKSKKITSTKKQQITSRVAAGEMGEQDDVATKEQGEVAIDGSVANIVTKQNTKPAVSKDSASLKDSTKTSVAKIKTDNKTKQKANRSASSRLYFLTSVGGEIGSVKLLAFKNNPVTAKFGAGIGYQVNKKLSVQAGFYAGTKKYIAGPDDYNAKAGSYWNMVQIVKVNAACLVYDIPVTVRYNFLQKSGLTYFATAGVSSYIMKKEDYDYYYIRYNTPHESAYSYTGNKSAFSVLNISAGIEKKLSSSFSLQLEPTLSVPLSGVGDGQVKLFNAALQIGIKYQPIKKH